jgi:DNA-binding MarR family transcriptional regulator
MRDDGASRDPFVIGLFSEILMIDQLARTRLGRALPKGMELSHFMVLNHLAGPGGEKTPARLAGIFNLTRGAMTNTLQKLEAAGYVHVRPDWEDARSKRVGISPTGRAARDEAVRAMEPVLEEMVGAVDTALLRELLPLLRELRQSLDHGA